MKNKEAIFAPPTLIDCARVKMAGVFAEQVAIVTGGGQGLGRAIAEMLVNNGARVLLFDLDDKKGEEAARFLGKAARYYKVYIYIWLRM